MKRTVRIFLLIVAIGALSFILSKFFEENSESLQLQLFGWRTRPLGAGLLIAAVFFTAVFFSFFVTFTAVIAKSIEAGRLRRENRSLQKLLEEKTHSSSSKI
ncbi:MAG: hypothetical protein JWQ35_841 [Bacteriovoracaceae bacterium]|nr:hypothetical protein [Bacteriovoracaceae bacterium]